MSNNDIITASCLCGKNTFSSPIPAAKLPLEVDFCHCNSCRHGTGTLSLVSIPWPSEDLPQNLDSCTRFAFSPRADIYFCTTCGTWLFWHSKSIPWLAVMTGALQNPAQWCRPLGHIFVTDTRDGGLSVFLKEIKGKKMGRYRGYSTAADGEVDDNWPGIVASKEDHNGEKELKAYCKCGGVKFQVTRPNDESANLDLDTSEEAREKGTWWLNQSQTKFTAGFCVCDSCRLASGIDYMPWTYIPASNLRLEDGSALPDPPVFGTLKSYSHSTEADRYFCGDCGATIFYVEKSRPRLLDVAIGLLDAASGARAEEWLDWVSNRVSHLQDGLKRDFMTEDLVKGLKVWGEHQPTPHA